MRITDLEAKRQLNLVELCLTRAEAQELQSDLDVLLTGGRDRHEHVSSSDYQTELTVWIDDDQ